MTRKLKPTIIVVLGVGIALTLAYVISGYSSEIVPGTEASRSEETAETPLPDDQPGADHQDSKEKIRDVIAKINELRKQETENPTEKTPEEIEYLKYRNKRIGEHYWELAPMIFEEVLSEQTLDARWTEEKLSAMREKLSEEALGGTTLKSVECYENLCRIIVEHEDEEAYKTFKSYGTESGPLDGPSHGSRKPLEDGRLQTTVYLSRPTDSSPFKEVERRMLTYVEDNNL